MDETTGSVVSIFSSNDSGSEVFPQRSEAVTVMDLSIPLRSLFTETASETVNLFSESSLSATIYGEFSSLTVIHSPSCFSNTVSPTVIFVISEDTPSSLL